MNWYIDSVPQWSYYVVAAVGLAIALGVSWLLAVRTKSLSLVGLATVVGFVIMSYGLVVAFNGNYYRVTEGRVTETGHRPDENFYYVQVTDPNTGHTGRIRFEEDPSARHPVGSYYNGS